MGYLQKQATVVDVETKKKYSSLEARIKSFDAGWPHKDFVGCPPAKLAASGLYFSPTASQKDRTICFNCDVAVRNWENGDDANKVHQKQSPDCSFVNNLIAQNEMERSLEAHVSVKGPNKKLFTEEEFLDSLVESGISKESAQKGVEALFQKNDAPEWVRVHSGSAAECKEVTHTLKSNGINARGEGIDSLDEDEDLEQTMSGLVNARGSIADQTTIAFVNKRSGGKTGEKWLSKLREVIGVSHVFVLDERDGGPDPGLDQFRNHKNLRILVAGGDGSVGWVLEGIDEAKFAYPPKVAILPLGTGNDLARSLGWTKKTSSGMQAKFLLRLVDSGSVQNLDRWQVAVKHVKPAVDGMEVVTTELKSMNNYFGVGFDAMVGLKYHNLREENTPFTGTKAMNKLVHLYYGAFYKKWAPRMRHFYDLKIDGESVNIPKGVRGLVVVNIPSYAGGRTAWVPTKGISTKLDDGLVEVVGIKSMADFVNPTKRFVRLGQGSHIVFTPFNDAGVDLQVDGEPWEAPSCIIEIKKKNQVQMITPVRDHGN